MGGSYRFGPVEIVTQERELRVQGQRVPLGSRAFDLLLALIERRGRVVAKAELIDAVWPDTVVEENNLAAQVVALRKALGADAIATIPGRGYQFTLRLDESPEPSASHSELPVSNIPAAMDALVGRDGELEAVRGMLDEWRLVQIVGPGGIGKTCLAQEIARGCAAQNTQDVCWVDLAAVSSPERIAPAIASVTAVRLADGEGLDQLAHALAKRRMLLVLDSCEHICADVAYAVNVLLAAASELRIVVTSQEVVRSPGSGVYRLGALPVPPAGVSLEASRSFGAMQLLERRARAVDPRFVLSDETVADAISLCARLDGVPLALEMAAARLPMMGAQALGTHLDRHLEILRNTSVDAQDRQRTLRATLEWSHSLLTDDERRVLRHLSAFVGTFRLEVAQFVAFEIGLAELDAIDALVALVDKSLVQLESSEPPRYRLLETTRRFAQEELAIRGERDAAWQLHGRAMARLAEEVRIQLWKWEVRRWIAAYMPDYPDLQQAFDRASERSDPDVLAATADALRWLDFERDMESDVRRRKEAAMALLPRASPRARARLLSSVQAFRVVIPAGANRVELGREHVAAWAALGDRFRHCLALSGLAVNLAAAGRSEEAIAAIEESRALEDPQWPPRPRQTRAYHEAEVALYCRDERWLRAACETIARLGSWRADPRMTSLPDLELARLALVAGDEDPVPILSKVVDDLRRLGRPRRLSNALATLCSAHVKAGDLEQARAAVAEALDLAGRQKATYVLDHLALFASCTDRCADSARLLGFNDTMYAEAQDRRTWPDGWAAEEADARNGRVLGTESARRLRSEGASLGRSEAEALASDVVARRTRAAETA